MATALILAIRAAAEVDRQCRTRRRQLVRHFTQRLFDLVGLQGANCGLKRGRSGERWRFLSAAAARPSARRKASERPSHARSRLVVAARLHSDSTNARDGSRIDGRGDDDDGGGGGGKCARKTFPVERSRAAIPRQRERRRRRRRRRE